MTTNTATTADIRELLRNIPAGDIPSLTPKRLQEMLVGQGFEVTASTRVATSTELKKARRGKPLRTTPSKSVPHPPVESGPVENRTTSPLAKVGLGHPTKKDVYARRLVMACGGSAEKAVQTIHDQDRFFAELSEVLSDN